MSFLYGEESSSLNAKAVILAKTFERYRMIIPPFVVEWMEEDDGEETTIRTPKTWGFLLYRSED